MNAAGGRRPARPPGLQPERTALAWHRTGIAGSAVAGIALLTAARDGVGWRLAVVSTVAVLCAGAAGAAGAQAAPAPPGAPRRSPYPRLLATAVVPVLLACAGVVLCLPRRG